MRRLKPDPIPDAVLRQIMDAAICAPSGGNRQGWSFLVIRDAAKRARLGELYHEAWSELMKTPYYPSRVGGIARQPGRQDGRLGEPPLRAPRRGAGPRPGLHRHRSGVRPTITTGASIYPAVQNLMLAARALGVGSRITTIHKYRDPQVKELLGIPAEVERPRSSPGLPAEIRAPAAPATCRGGPRRSVGPGVPGQAG